MDKKQKPSTINKDLKIIAFSDQASSSQKQIIQNSLLEKSFPIELSDKNQTNQSESEIYDTMRILGIEKLLQKILKRIITKLEYILVSEEEKCQVEQFIHDYSTLEELITIIENLLQELLKKLDKQLKEKNQITYTEEYDNLEKQIQKYENEIRQHIRIQQQVKLYVDVLEEKVEVFEKEKTT